MEPVVGYGHEGWYLDNRLEESPLSKMQSPRPLPHQTHPQDLLPSTSTSRTRITDHHPTEPLSSPLSIHSTTSNIKSKHHHTNLASFLDDHPRMHAPDMYCRV